MDYSKIVEEYERQSKLYEDFGEAVKTILHKALEQTAIKIHSIEARPKKPSSLKRKLERAVPPYTDPLRQITDLSGVRIITHFPTDVDKVADVVRETFSIDEENSIDKRKIDEPTQFGYSSLHYVVQLDSTRRGQVEYSRFADLKCEIQIRTILQHAWAEIEHDFQYKADIDIPLEIRRRFAALSGLLEIADREFEFIRREEGKIRERVAASVIEEKLKIPINMVSLQEYLKDRKLGKHSLGDISASELSDLISDFEGIGVRNLEDLDSAIKRFDLNIDDVEEQLKKRTGFQADLHPVGILRIILANAYPDEFARVMELKLNRTKGRVREFNTKMTTEILRIVRNGKRQHSTP